MGADGEHWYMGTPPPRDLVSTKHHFQRHVLCTGEACTWLDVICSESEISTDVASGTFLQLPEPVLPHPQVEVMPTLLGGRGRKLALKQLKYALNIKMS